MWYQKSCKVMHAVIWMLSFLFLSTDAFAARWYEYYLDAQKAAENEAWDTVVEKLKKVIALEPKPEKKKRAYGMRRIDYYPYLRLGQAYLTLGDAENAHFYCEQAKKHAIAPKSDIEKCLQAPLKASTSPSPAPEKMKVAVLDFTNPAGNNKEFATAIANTLQTKLIGLKNYTIIVRGESLSKVIEELAFQQTGVVDEETAVEVGKQIGAKFVITGTVIKPGSFYTVNAVLIDVETGIAINAASITAKRKDSILGMIPELALKLTGATLGTEE